MARERERPMDTTRSPETQAPVITLSDTTGASRK